VGYINALQSFLHKSEAKYRDENAVKRRKADGPFGESAYPIYGASGDSDLHSSVSVPKQRSRGDSVSTRPRVVSTPLWNQALNQAKVALLRGRKAAKLAEDGDYDGAEAMARSSVKALEESVKCAPLQKEVRELDFMGFWSDEKMFRV
jgi:hypothetical protein